jgi:hypothetical protein
MKLPITVASAFAVGLLAFTATAFAAGLVDQPSGDLAEMILTAVTGGQYWLAALVAVVLAVRFARQLAPETGPLSFLRSGPGAAALVLIGSFVGSLATSVAATGGISWGIVAAATTALAVGAGGLFSLTKPFVPPFLNWLMTKVPAVAHPAIRLVLWVYSRPDPDTVATAAGDKAVAENPSSGAAGIVGAPRDVR